MRGWVIRGGFGGSNVMSKTGAVVGKPPVSWAPVMSPRGYDRWMAGAATWAEMRELAVEQFGLFTAAQARRRGIHSYELTRRVRTGELFRAAHRGVYGFADQAATMHRFEDWAAQWLGMRPDVEAQTRRKAPDCIVSHESAALIRDLGTAVARGLFLTGPRRMAARSPAVHIYRREIGEQGADWDVVDGFPAATPRRIIVDLARDHLDGSHQGAVIADVIDAGLLSANEVAVLLDPFAGDWGETDGGALVALFTEAAGRPVRRPS